ncbi:unnamed protein product, partial [Heterotrigona itama]
HISRRAVRRLIKAEPSSQAADHVLLSKKTSSISSSQTEIIKMVSIRFCFTIIVVLFVVAVTVNAAYRKPPFNGSIFGKRSNTIT